MPQSISQVYLHSVWSTKNRIPMIPFEVEESLYAYMGGIIKGLGGIPLQINGMPEHIHVLSILPRTITIAAYHEEIKKSSSKWIKTKDRQLNQFAWQRGYAVFSVSQSVVTRVGQYIINQKEHHRKLGYQSEVLSMLKEYGAEYNEQYLWD